MGKDQGVKNAPKKILKQDKATRKKLSLPQPFLQNDARLVLSFGPGALGGKSNTDVVVSVKGRYGWLTVGLIEKFSLSPIMSKLETSWVRPGTLTEPFEIKVIPAPSKLSPEDAAYVEYVHGLIQGIPTDDDEDIKNELAAQQKAGD